MTMMSFSSLTVLLSCSKTSSVDIAKKLRHSHELMYGLVKKLVPLSNAEHLRPIVLITHPYVSRNTMEAAIMQNNFLPVHCVCVNSSALHSHIPLHIYNHLASCTFTPLSISRIERQWRPAMLNCYDYRAKMLPLE